MHGRTLWSRSAVLLLLLLSLVACGSPGTAGTSGTSSAATSAAATSSPATEATAAQGATTGATMATPTSAATAATTASAGTGATSAATQAAASTAIPSGGGATIRVGSKNFTEEFIIAEMYAHLLEANGFKVERKLNLGAEQVAHQALLSKQIDLYPEYTSTGLLTILKMQPIKDPQQIYQTVKSEYEKRFQLTWLMPSPFNDTNALAMTKKRADELGIKTYTDLSKKADQLVVGGPPEFYAREDGLPGLQKAYGGFKFKATKQLDPGLRYQALKAGQIDVVRAFRVHKRITSG